MGSQYILASWWNGTSSQMRDLHDYNFLLSLQLFSAFPLHRLILFFQYKWFTRNCHSQDCSTYCRNQIAQKSTAKLNGEVNVPSSPRIQNGDSRWFTYTCHLCHSHIGASQSCHTGGLWRPVNTPMCVHSLPIISMGGYMHANNSTSEIMLLCLLSCLSFPKSNQLLGRQPA